MRRKFSRKIAPYFLICKLELKWEVKKNTVRSTRVCVCVWVCVFWKTTQHVERKHVYILTVYRMAGKLCGVCGAARSRVVVVCVTIHLYTWLSIIIMWYATISLCTRATCIAFALKCVCLCARLYWHKM